MRPEWFEFEGEGGDGTLPPIPLEKMWASDKHWFPLLLSRQHFVGRSDYTKSVQDGVETFALQRWWFGTKSA
jgi:8-oxo-dGTP diphosphatase / 2-hydroxy-dATP diphosphatase